MYSKPYFIYLRGTIGFTVYGLGLLSQELQNPKMLVPPFETPHSKQLKLWVKQALHRSISRKPGLVAQHDGLL